MNSASNVPNPANTGSVDDLDAFVVEHSESNPEFRARIEDLGDLDRVIDQLVEMRRRAGLSQKKLAHLMGVKQPTVSQFENESSDPRIGTVQRYARALGVRLHLGIEAEDQVSWTPRCSRFSPASVEWSVPTVVVTTHARHTSTSAVPPNAGQWGTQRAADESRAGYALVA